MYIYSLDFAFFDCLLFMSKLFQGPFRFYPGSIGCNFVFYFHSRQGIGEDGFVLFLGTSPILKLVYFDDIDSMALFDGENKDLQAHSTTYKISDRDKLVSFLSKNLESKFNMK